MLAWSFGVSAPAAPHTPVVSLGGCERVERARDPLRRTGSLCGRPIEEGGRRRRSPSNPKIGGWVLAAWLGGSSLHQLRHAPSHAARRETHEITAGKRRERVDDRHRGEVPAEVAQVDGIRVVEAPSARSSWTAFPLRGTDASEVDLSLCSNHAQLTGRRARAPLPPREGRGTPPRSRSLRTAGVRAVRRPRRSPRSARQPRDLAA